MIPEFRKTSNKSSSRGFPFINTKPDFIPNRLTPKYSPNAKRIFGKPSTSHGPRNLMVQSTKSITTKQFMFASPMGSQRTSNIWPFNDDNVREEDSQNDNSQPEREVNTRNIDLLIRHASGLEQIEEDPSFENNAVTNTGRLPLMKSAENLHIRKTMSEDFQFTPDKYQETFLKFPKEFKNNQIFQMIFAKKNEEPIRSRVQKRQAYSRLEIRNSKSDAETKGFYEIDKIGYKNYLYPKHDADVEKPKRNFFNLEKKEKLEETITTQKTLKMMSYGKRPPMTANPMTNESLRTPQMKTSGAFFGRKKIDELDEISNNGEKKFDILDGIQGVKKAATAKNEKRPFTGPTPNPYFRKTFVANFRSIIGDKTKSFKEQKLLQEFDYYANVSKKILEEKKATLNGMIISDEQRDMELYRINNALLEKGILVQVFFETQPIFKKTPRFIHQRVALALGANLSNEFATITWNQFYRFKSLLELKDATLEDMIDFSIKFFKVDEGTILKLEEFLRVLRCLTEKIDTRLGLHANLDSNLFDNFVENYIITGVIKQESDVVEMSRFKQVYSSHKMNIFDIIDLISGLI